MLLCSHHSQAQLVIGGSSLSERAGEAECRVGIDQHYGFYRDVAYTDCVPEQFWIVSVVFVLLPMHFCFAS